MHQRLATFLRRYGIAPRGVIHVGAHTAQERPHYVAAGFARELWIEPQPQVFARLVAALPPGTRTGIEPDGDGPAAVRAINAACGDAPGEALMHGLNDQGGGGGGDGLSNSLLEPTGIKGFFPGLTPGQPQRVRVVRLDDLVEQIERAEGGRGAEAGPGGLYSLICLDTQGYELHVLRGAERTLQRVEAVMAEVFTAEYYKGAPLVGEVDRFMAQRGFVKVQSRISRRRRFGDAFYVRGERVPAWRGALSRVGLVGTW